MYYEVPSKPPKTEKPKPIFPWEEHAPKPTRVFPEERPPSPEQVPEPEPEPGTEPRLDPVLAAESTGEAFKSPEVMRESPSSPSSASESDPWNKFTRTNAWDVMPEIERYVQAFAQARKGKIQVVHQAADPSEAGDQSLLSPSADRERRPSMRITDFPTEFERPSLPVTPAPRHPNFWGEERDDAGELPAAEGVPKQQDWVSRFSSYLQPRFASAASASHSPSRVLFWRCQFCGKQNPVEKLEELQRRQSHVLERGPELKPKELPTREMPASARDPVVARAEAAAKASSSAQPAAANGSKQTTKSVFTTKDATTLSVANASSPAKPKSILKEPSCELGGPSSKEVTPAAKDLVPEVPPSGVSMAV